MKPTLEEAIAAYKLEKRREYNRIKYREYKEKIQAHRQENKEIRKAWLKRKVSHIPKELCHDIQRWRILHNFSVKGFAEHLGLSYYYVNHILYGHVPIPEWILEAVGIKWDFENDKDTYRSVYAGVDTTKHQLCEYCDNYGCSWMTDEVAIPKWKARLRGRNPNKYIYVERCPKFRIRGMEDE